MVPASTWAGAVGDVTLTINLLSNALVANDYIHFEFPSVSSGWSFDSGGNTACTVEQPSGTPKTLSFRRNVNKIEVEVSQAIDTTSGALVVKCTNVKNPTAVVPTGTMTVWTTFGGTSDKKDEGTATVSEIKVGTRSCTVVVAMGCAYMAVEVASVVRVCEDVVCCGRERCSLCGRGFGRSEA